ncbi:MAG: hypothetical protein IPK82_35215 [Polyangiaceae bacterium]|nr:hypothetical protein [Polyangiaceae bacterium]
MAAFFGAEKDKERELLRRDHLNGVNGWKKTGLRGEVEDQSDLLRKGEKPVYPFHWEIEFPEVFGRQNPGFDAMVGNPPFLGGSSISSNFGPGMLQWLLALHSESHGNADLVAHFYRRAFSLVRKDGMFGLIATNTIAQGDTRGSGLRWICTHGGEIYTATRRVKWPGLAAVVVSVVHVKRGEWKAPRLLDGREVPLITAFLFHKGEHGDPQRLHANDKLSFKGSMVYGLGFTFDDTDKSGTATSLAEMERLKAKNPRNAERIFPYIGGEEVNTSPTHTHHRYVINFGEMTEEEARCWPDLMTIVEAKVKPERDQLADNPDGRRRKTYWWQWGRYTPALFRAIVGLDRVLVIARVSNAFAFTFLSARVVLNEKIVVIPTDKYSSFCALQAQVHQVWGRFFNSSLKDDMQYTPSDCFETFPFPPNWQTDPTLEAAGNTYYQFRADLMVKNNEGLTKTYNRFHDPNEQSPDIRTLRNLHTAMDRAVLAAYGWTDIPTACDFFLDYEIDEETWGDKKNLPATAGPTPFATKCSPACSTSTNAATKKKPSPAHSPPPNPPPKPKPPANPPNPAPNLPNPKAPPPCLTPTTTDHPPPCPPHLPRFPRRLHRPAPVRPQTAAGPSIGLVRAGQAARV